MGVRVGALKVFRAHVDTALSNLLSLPRSKQSAEPETSRGPLPPVELRVPTSLLQTSSWPLFLRACSLPAAVWTLMLPSRLLSLCNAPQKSLQD